VISPEGCASILWKSAEKAPEAAEAMNMTSGRLKEQGLIDEIIAEPLGGAHRSMPTMYENLSNTLNKLLDELEKQPIEQLVEARYQRFMSFGQFIEETV
jgi:acetyl-CoA carboxylase carboxyl transferase subunit alpha